MPRTLTLILSLLGIAGLLAGERALAEDASRSRDGSVPALESLHLEAWTPSNEFRRVRRLEDTPPTALGFNEQFIWGYLQARGVACSDCAGNSPPIPLMVAESYLDGLSQNGVRVAREIVPERYFADPSNHAAIGTIVKEYQRRRFTLVFTVGWPVEGRHGECFGFAGGGEGFDRAAYDYSSAAARLLLDLYTQPGIDRAWAESHILIEPWNEFDGMCGGSVGSPRKAARYQGVMQLVFDRAGVRNEILMPSVVNVFRVPALTAGRTGRYGKMNAYLADYYRSGGSGRPNVHLYFDPGWGDRPSELGKILEDQVAEIARSVPDAYGGQAIVGEIGVADQSDVAKCNAHAMTEDARASLYQQVAGSQAVKREVEIMLFWRLFSLEGMMKPLDNCDQFYGMTRRDWSHVESPAEALDTFTPSGRNLLRAAQGQR